MNMETIFISGVQTELASERKALFDFINGGCCMTIFICTFVPIEVRNILEFLSECILNITNYTNGLLFSSYATASMVRH